VNSGAGIGQKPDDWRTVPLCGGDSGFDGCHAYQHRCGEQSFWNHYQLKSQQTVEQLIEELINASPKRREIEAIRKERGL
jgi:hypothetical protein